MQVRCRPTNPGNVLDPVFPAFRLFSPPSKAVDYHTRGGRGVPPHSSECLLARSGGVMGIATRPVPQDEENAWPDPPQQACIFSCLFLHVDESRAPSLFHTGTLHPPKVPLAEPTATYKHVHGTRESKPSALRRQSVPFQPCTASFDMSRGLLRSGLVLQPTGDYAHEPDRCLDIDSSFNSIFNGHSGISTGTRLQRHTHTVDKIEYE